MESTEEKSNREALKEKVHAWRKPYQEALEAVVAREDATLDDLADVIWEKGILDRIAPLDEEEKRARKELGSDVWDGTREDSELYLRIMYSSAYSIEAQKRHLTAAPSPGYAGAAMATAFGAVIDELDRFFTGEARKDPVSAMSSAIVDRARMAANEQGGPVHREPIPWGAEGVFCEILVRVTNYTPDGRVVLETKNSKDHPRLGEVTKFGAVSPIELNPEDFKIPEPPDFISQEFEIPGGRAAGTKLREVEQFLVEHHIVPDYDASWQRSFFDATRSYEGKQVRVRVVFEKGKGISFEAEEIT